MSYALSAIRHNFYQACLALGVKWSHASTHSIAMSAFQRTANEYFSPREISRLLKEVAFIGHRENQSTDPWRSVNSFRSCVAPALNVGLSTLLAANAKENHPIIEIGSGIGYRISDNLSARLIRSQPSHLECQLLHNTVSEPIYQTDIEGLCKALLTGEKKISLFFALNVFDTLSPEERRVGLSQISQLQGCGDRLLIMLDTNPLLENTIAQIESLHPGHIAFPYFPLANKCVKCSVILVPSEKAASKPSTDDILAMIERETLLLMRGQVSRMQYQLHQLQRELNLRVIPLEDFFVEQTQKELRQANYSSEVYYHTSFTVGEPPKDMPPIKQDLVYKAVTDTLTVRQWALDDQNLLECLAKKRLSLPTHFNAAFLRDLREMGQKIFGAEILVINAQKIF